MKLLRSLRKRLPRAIASRLWSGGAPAARSLGYAIALGEDVHNAMRRLQIQLLEQSEANVLIEPTPHITLKQGFEITRLEPFERYFEDLIRDVEPFEIQIRGVDFFDEGILFLDVAQSNPLCALRERVVSDLSRDFGISPNPIETSGYRFHATVASLRMPVGRVRLRPRAGKRLRGQQGNMLDAARRAFGGDAPFEFRFPCEKLELLLYTGPEWITYRRSTLERSRLHGADIHPAGKV